MRLSDASVRSLPTPQKGQKTYWDDTLRGFGCRVSQGGSRSFVLQHGADRQLITIGKYHPDILTLSTARTEAKRILAERVLGKHRPSSVTFDEAKRLFLEACKRKNKPRTVYDYTRILNRHFAFGRKQLSDISPADIQRKLDRIQAPAELRYATVLAKTFFRWAYKRAHIDQSPAERLDTRQSTTRSRVLSDTELQLIWRACEQTTALPSVDVVREASSDVSCRLPAHFTTIVKLLILTGQRRGEIAALRSEYVSLTSTNNSTNHNPHDAVGHSPSVGALVSSSPPLHTCTITLPSELTKNGREHTFPLGSIAFQLLNSAISSNARALFPARGSDAKPFNGWSKSKAALDQLSGVTDWTLHDLRRTVATRMAELGVAPHVIERILNHVTGTMSPLSRVYNRASFLAEMRAAIELWEAHLSALCGIASAPPQS